MDLGLGLDPWVILAIGVALFLVLHAVVRWPLPLSFLAVSAAIMVLGESDDIFRHLVEGGFGFINLVLGLFAGAFFGHVMRATGAADAAADGMVRLAGGRVLPVLFLAGLPLFLVGMFVGLAGIAVLAAGVFALPALRRLGFEDPTIAAFIAITATAGMIAPPLNIPAMLMADGVNMPYVNFTGALLALSLPFVVAALIWFTWGRGPTLARTATVASGGAALLGVFPLMLIVVIWIVIRSFGTMVIDIASPLVMVIGGLVALPRLRGGMRELLGTVFTGTPLLLAAVLVTVGILVQAITLVGIRGDLVVSAMSLREPWNYPSLLIGMPILGGVLSSMGSSAVLGIPAAFTFISQDMILNVAALSGMATLAEFVPPTAIAAALSCYVVGGPTVGQVIRRAWPPLLFLAVLSVLMLALAPWLDSFLT